MANMPNSFVVYARKFARHAAMSVRNMKHSIVKNVQTLVTDAQKNAGVWRERLLNIKIGRLPLRVTFLLFS